MLCPLRSPHTAPGSDPTKLLGMGEGPCSSLTPPFCTSILDHEEMIFLTVAVPRTTLCWKRASPLLPSHDPRCTLIPQITSQKQSPWAEWPLVQTSQKMWLPGRGLWVLEGHKCCVKRPGFQETHILEHGFSYAFLSVPLEVQTA